jgi:hypothetical protein
VSLGKLCGSVRREGEGVNRVEWLAADFAADMIGLGGIMTIGFESVMTCSSHLIR